MRRILKSESTESFRAAACLATLSDRRPPVSHPFLLKLTRLLVDRFRCPSALRSAPLSKSIYTTMASADFPARLQAGISPGKVHELSTRAVRLYTMRLLVTVGLCVSSHAHRPHHASLPVCVPTVGFSLKASFARHPYGFRLAATTVVVTISGYLLSDNKFMPVLGTLAPTILSGRDRDRIVSTRFSFRSYLNPTRKFPRQSRRGFIHRIRQPQPTRHQQTRKLRSEFSYCAVAFNSHIRICELLVGCLHLGQ